MEPGSPALRGFADLHNHQFADLGFGRKAVWGRALGPVETALGSCSPLHGPFGSCDVVDAMVRLAYLRRLPSPHTHGKIGRARWPSWDTFTHQSVHQDWLRRAVDGGLRLMVMLALNDEWLARTLRAPKADRPDMVNVERQLQAAYDFQDAIDADAGGEGLGWYRVVHTPAEAWTAIADGKLAVVLGVEVSALFGMHAEDVAPAELDTRVSELEDALQAWYDKGVRYVFPVHFGDNGFGGGAFDNPLIRDMDSPWLSRANPPLTLGPYRVSTVDGSAHGLRYRGGRRNRTGLTGLGRHLISMLMDRGMLFDLNHMSLQMRDEVLFLCEERDYPPVAGHSAFLDICAGNRRTEAHLTSAELERIRALNGMLGMILGQGSKHDVAPWRGREPSRLRSFTTSRALVHAYEYAVAALPGLPVAIGSDLNGFATLPGPRFGGGSRDDDATRLPYPFQGPSGVELDRSTIGDRVLDLNEDGLCHVGMLPDLVADLSRVGSPSLDLEPLHGSAAGFVALWERARVAR
ncbi:membrane dipeptidase [Cellulomonas sp. zg-ZUI40]|nr:membrane dipeptidase [Cellulomonas dongxiuzhuiae]